MWKGHLQRVVVATNRQKASKELTGDLLPDLSQYRVIRRFRTKFIEPQDVFKGIELLRYADDVEFCIYQRKNSLDYRLQRVATEVVHLEMPKSFVARDVDVQGQDLQEIKPAL
jgi:hypothetical protein